MNMWHEFIDETPTPYSNIIVQKNIGEYVVGTYIGSENGCVAYVVLMSHSRDEIKFPETAYWSYFDEPKNKEFHIFIDGYNVQDTVVTFAGTLELLRTECKNIKTTQLVILKPSLLDDYRVFLHRHGKQIEITLGKCQGIDEEITPTTDLVKLVMDGKFRFK